MILILCLFDAMGVLWVVEQPAGSFMQFWPRFEWFIGSRVMYRHSLKMWDFGANSTKPTWLYSNMPWIRQLDDFRPVLQERSTKKLVDSWQASDGKQKCQGNRNTKGSQAYPRGFGEAFEELMSDHVNDILLSSQGCQSRALLSAAPVPKGDDHWCDANLLPVLARLSY